MGDAGPAAATEAMMEPRSAFFSYYKDDGKEVLEEVTILAFLVEPSYNYQGDYGSQYTVNPETIAVVIRADGRYGTVKLHELRRTK